MVARVFPQTLIFSSGHIFLSLAARATGSATMCRAELHWKSAQVALGLILATSVLGLCPPMWIPYREELCLYVPAGPALSWSEASIFCQDQNAKLVVIKDYNKQMFLTDHTDGAKGPASLYWIGLAWQEANAQLTWVDGTPISQSWYSSWLQGHPKKGHCVQIVGFYAGQWRDWDCRANTSFICEMPAKDAFPGSVKKVRFRSRCYTFHFPSFREVRSWREAQAFCQETGESLAVVHDEEENAFLSYAFPEDGWHMWIGLRFGTAWKWSDSSPLGYFWWHPEEAPSEARDRCVVLQFWPADVSRHGTWKTRPCNKRPVAEATGFICQHGYNFCGPLDPAHFPLPGGMGLHATVDVIFSLSAHSTCSLLLTELHTNTTPFKIHLKSDTTHVHGSILSELGGFSVHKNFPRAPFSSGLNTWSFVTHPGGVVSFFNHQEHFRLSDIRDISFTNLGALQITGVTVANASLEYRLSSELRFPGGSSLQLQNAIGRYLSHFTIGLWLRSNATSPLQMCLVSYSRKWKPPDFALFLLFPSGLKFHFKGTVLFSSTRGSLLDGAWHHVAVSVSSAPWALPSALFVDGKPWALHRAKHANVLPKGLSLGGKMSIGQLEVDSRGTSFYVGDLSEVNLWDQALPELSVQQLAASRTRWKYPGNVVSWSQLVAQRPAALQISTPGQDPDTAFVWFGLLQLRGKTSVLCADPERSWIYVEPAPKRCLNHSFWGLQLNGRLRSVADPSSCLLVASDGVSLLSSSDCSTNMKSSFRLLPDQRLQNLYSGFCAFQDIVSARLYLGKCTPQALYFVIDRDVHCPQSPAWRSRKDKCLLFMLDVALEWSQALRFCQRFHGGSLATLNSPADLARVQTELQVSVWTGLHGTGRDLWSWADETPFNKALKRFIFSPGTSGTKTCLLALTSGALKVELCNRPHRWICQTSRQSDAYVAVPGRSFYGSFSVDLAFPSLQRAKQQCSALGRGCNMVVSTVTGHRLAAGTRFVALKGPAAQPGATVHVKSGCSPGFSGQDCQSMCPHCEPSTDCNPLTGLCDGFLHYEETTATYASLKCLPFGDWVYDHGSCVSSERYSSQEEARAVCNRYLGADVQKVPAKFSGAQRKGTELDSVLWACQRAEDAELPSLREKLLVSLQGPSPPQRRASLQQALDACYLQKERCSGVLSLRSACYVVAGTVLADIPGSEAILYVKSACSPGFYGERCQKRRSPCFTTRTFNPWTGQCDGHLSCVRRFSPSCLHGLVNSRCPRHPGWWFWEGHCYYVEEQSLKDWREARAACQAYGHDIGLLTLSSAEEKGWIGAMVQQDSWTGLNDADKDGTWMWEGGQAADLSSPWLADVQLITGHCLGIRPQGEQILTTTPCSELKPWVCKGTPVPWNSCPWTPGWRHWNGSCYFWDPSVASGWHEARQACRRFRKTELLYLTSPQEKDWVHSNFRDSFWTGLNDLKLESVFQWTTQEPLSQQMAEFLRDDMADGGLKDCVWLDVASGLLRDAKCNEKKPFLCKCSAGTEWFDKKPGRGVAKEPSLMYPSAESLEAAKRECLMERQVCAAVLQTETGFYLISTVEEIISQPVCAEGFRSPHCQKVWTPPPRPACDCSGKFQTTAKKVCGIPVQRCVDDCQSMTTWRNCSLCLPACSEASLSNLDPEELALITMVHFKVSHSLNLTAEDERDRGNSSKIIYDAKYP
ncbi:uncharacterized protein LOC128339115 isoform X2 [Hemicordylus capensis]|uniref:uncharacterized protein LOC128339115 isoform X2 n=1 Tax=Hemicordylus capensis TaxID=884348 RepID=UPI0023029B41|nr:uncharacterized protein LOC128339115 isoform X2 [Hemicordylus capensis]